jgi:Protein phosphatase 2C
MLVKAFMGTDIAFREELLLHRNSKRITQKQWHPGCTAIAALVIREKLYVANAGDCRAILNRSGQPFLMSKVIRHFKINLVLVHFHALKPKNFLTI